jgi:hypothetical protein
MPVARQPFFRPRLECLEDRAVPSSTILTSVPNPASQGQVVTFTAIVNQTGTDNVQPGTGSPVRGTVTFFDGSTPLAVVTVTPSSVHTQGMAVFATSGLVAGSHALHATYSGETNAAVPGSATGASDSGVLTVNVTATATQDQITRVTLDGFYTAYGVAFNNAVTYFFGVSDYLNVISTVSGSVQQQLAQVYYTTFYIDYFLLVS